MKDGAALAGLAVGMNRLASGQTVQVATSEATIGDKSGYGERSQFEKALRTTSYGDTLHTPLEDSVGIITPTSLHYTVTEGKSALNIDPSTHRLMIHGLVDRPLIFTMDELKRLPSVSRIHFLECVANTSPTTSGGLASRPKVQETHGRMGCAEWTGVPLSLLLKEAGLKNTASWVLAEGADERKHTSSLPLDKALDDVILAYGQNGEAVRPENGYPLRLMIPGWEGVRNIKWLRRIKVTDQPYMAHRETVASPSLRLDGKARWFQFEMGPKSVITRPSGGQRLPNRGFCEITGLAWSSGGAIRRVEISADGGRTWIDAQLQDPVLRIAHTRFHLDWNWNGEEAVLQSRCTDERGTVQPSLAELGKIWGVSPDYWQSTSNSVIHFNAIHSWKVNRDGSVQNALFA